ncbi:hypothetical protein [Streptomyces sp. ISL-100]|uniref:hypothetical protein n=1 Tax=Streptomyces sp. ISL-100 TaxID=2819173 RepID=UPI001BE99207|nr:hypothetical protein [Streptomyces sp. ISL-100]MBT2395371.1 hypothetical protein [Streptomyces sp. ISL-100]
MGRDEVLRLLQEREAACRGEADRLRQEAERIAELLTACEEELARISTACQVVGELPMVHTPAGPVRPPVPSPHAEMFRPGRAEVRDAGEVLTEQVLEVLTGPAGPVRCRQVVEGLGLEVTPRNVGGCAIT